MFCSRNNIFRTISIIVEYLLLNQRFQQSQQPIVIGNMSDRQYSIFSPCQPVLVSFSLHFKFINTTSSSILNSLQNIVILMKAIILCIICIQIVLPQNFDTFKTSMEEKVRKLATDMSDIYARRCDNNIIQCEIKSYNQCEGTSEKKCYDDFPKPSSCVSDGATLSDQSATRFPNDVNTNSLSDDQRHFVCTSAILETSFKQLDTDRNQQYGIAYIGTTFGSLRAYPTFRQVDSNGQCVDYDPRFRPWYVTATSGGKNVILIIDVSGSMEVNRLQIAKDAAKSVVNTLSNNDFLGVIEFSSAATYMVSEKITRATIEHKEALTASIDSLVANGMTNYESAFRLGFSMLESAQSDEFGSPCSDSENIFLFLTDGQPTMGANTSESLINVIDEYNSGFNITMFTYGMGSGIDVSILSALACTYNGIMFEVEDSASDSQLTTLMRSYYIYISEGIEVPNPVWTQPYDDFFGFGRMVTVSMPIYYEESGIRKILGVAGIDVTMETFTNFGLEDEVQITKELISGSPCLKSSLSPCDLEELRPLGSQCGQVGCVASGTIIDCSNGTNSEIFLTPLNEDSDLCCGMTVGALVGIIVGIVIVVAIAIGCIVYQIKKSRSEQALQNPNRNPTNKTNIIIQSNPNNMTNAQFQQGGYPNNNYPPQYNNPYGNPPPMYMQ